LYGYGEPAGSLARALAPIESRATPIAAPREHAQQAEEKIMPTVTGGAMAFF